VSHEGRGALTAASRPTPAHSCAGVTLVELLVATCVTAVALAGAWAWLWSAGGVVRAAAARAQTATSAAFVVRSVADDLGLAAALSCPPAGMSPDRALCMVHRHGGAPAETVLVAWDASRQVLWRKASGTYLADHVESFVVEYFRADGRRLESGDFATADWPYLVARVTVTVEVTVDGHTARATRTVVLMPETVV
jgi:type II secretory pathway component PulJ